MKNIITIIILIFISLNVFSQNHRQKIVYVEIKDTLILPKSYSLDSNVITNDLKLDSIYNYYAVKSMIQVSGSNEMKNILDSIFQLKCDSNELNLLNALKEYNRLNNYMKFYNIFLLPKAWPEYIPNDFIDSTLKKNDGNNYLDIIHARDAWDVIRSHMRQKIIVGVNDGEGFKINHVDLINQIIPKPYNDTQSSLRVESDHGTFCAGVVGMQNDNNIGSCSLGGLCNLLTFSKDDNFLFTKFTDWVNNDHPRVISCSWGDGDTITPGYQAAIDLLYNQGVIIVTGAGYWGFVSNGGRNTNMKGKKNYPAAFNHVISVTSTNPYKKITQNRFPGLDLCAQGESIYSTCTTENLQTDSFRFGSGPSAAVPIVASLCGAILSINPCLNPDEVESIIKISGENIDLINDTISTYGARFINADSACKLAVNFKRGKNYEFTSGQDSTWNVGDNRQIASYIHIYHGGKLTIKSTVRFWRDAKIVVDPGGKLIIDGGYLTNSVSCINNCGCSDMWQGIVVLGDNSKSQWGNNQGKVILMHNAVIENAKIGIAVGTDANDGSQNGGVINTYGTSTQYSCTFKNCDIAVLIYKYKNISTGFNFCSFNKCHFLANAPLVDTRRYNGLSTSIFVKLEDVDGVRFYENTFENATNLTFMRPVGIQGIDATFTVQKSFINNGFDDNCLPTGNSNTFKNLRLGIEILSTRGNRKVKILDNTFENCTMGIKNKCDDNTKIYHNTFQYTNNHTMDSMEPDNRSISSYASRNMDIDQNTFTWNIASNQKAYGIQSDIFSTFTQNYSNIYKNTFSNLNGNKSIYANFIMGNQSAIKINCNTYQTTYDLLIFDHINDQYASSSPTFKEAGNIFHSCSSGSLNIINNSSTTRLNYYSTANKAPSSNCLYNTIVRIPGVDSNTCASHNPCDFYDCYCVIDTSSISQDDITSDISKIIFDKIYTADFVSADSLILTLNPTTDVNKIHLLTTVYNVFNDGRNYWHLTSSDSNNLIEVISYHDEASLYAENILGFYYGLNFSVDTPTILKLYKSVKNVSCYGGNDGSITTAIIGGVPPFTYSWSNGDTNMGLSKLNVGMYVLTITDSTGYFIRDTTTITQPTPLTFSATYGNTVNCFGDSTIVLFTPSGGKLPYYYRVNNSFNLTENTNYFHVGAYAVTLYDSNGCVFVNNINISSPSAIVISPVITNVSCYGGNDGEILLTVEGGVPNYVYTWSNNATVQHITDLSAGSYGLTVIDAHNCSQTDNIDVTQPSLLTSSHTVLNESCDSSIDGSVILNVSGGTSPFNFLWSNNETSQNITGLSAGIYDVTVTDSKNCTVEEEAIVYTDQLNVEIINGQNDNDLIAIVNSEFDDNYEYSYLWSTSDTTNSIYCVATGFSYDVTVTKRNNSNCFAVDSIFIMTQSRGGIMGVGLFNDLSLKIYPNPFNEELIVNLSNNSENAGSYSIVINNIFGKNVLTENLMTNKANVNTKILNLQHLTSGTYILMLYSNNKLIFRKKIIKM